MVRTTLAAKLKEFRTRAGLTINEAGEKVGKSGKTVSAWECGRGQPDADMLLALCDLYGVGSIAEFYGEQQPGFSLSADEMRLLTAYRELSQQGKEYILQTLDMAEKVYKKPNPVSNLEEKLG